MSGLLDENGDEPVNLTFEDLVGPGKKYANADELAKAYGHADKQIATLGADLDDIRTELTKRVTLEEALDKFAAPRDDVSTRQPPVTDTAPRNEPPAAGLDEDAVKGLLSKELNALRQKDLQDQNVKFVKDALVSAFGRNYVQRLKDRADELGVSVEYLSELSKTQPKVVLSLIGTPERQPPPGTPPRPALDTGRTFVDRRNERNYKYYNNMRKTDPKKYFAPKTRMEMHNDAMRLGDAFFE